MKNNKTIFSLLILNIIRTFIGILRSKIIAIKYTATELGILGQLITFTNFQNQFLLFGTGAALNNLIGKKNEDDQKIIFLISLAILLFSNSLFILSGSLFSSQISFWLFKSAQYSNYIILVILLGPLYSLYRFYEISLQSRREFKILIKGQLYIFSIAIISIIPLAYFWGVEGVIYNFAVWYIAGIVYFFNKRPLYMVFFSIRDNKDIIRKIFKICFTDLTRSISIFTALILFRIIIVQMLNLKDLGYFHAVWSLTNYTNVLVQGFIVFLFPTLSHHANSESFSKILNENFQHLLYIILPIIFLLAYIPEIFLYLLFSKEYTFLGNQLRWLSFGKIFEAIYLFYLIVFLSKDNFKWYIGLEIFRSILFVFTPLLLVKPYGFNGVIASVVFINIISFGLLIPTIFKLKIKMDYESSRIVIKAIIGIFVSIIISRFTENILINILVMMIVFYSLFGIKNYIKTLQGIYSDVKNKEK